MQGNLLTGTKAHQSQGFIRFMEKNAAPEKDFCNVTAAKSKWRPGDSCKGVRTAERKDRVWFDKNVCHNIITVIILISIIFVAVRQQN